MHNYVELPAGGSTDGVITAFAEVDEGTRIVCRINDEWYEFLA